MMIVTEIFTECYSLSFFYASFLLLSACFLLPVNGGGKGFSPTEGERGRERKYRQVERILGERREQEFSFELEDEPFE